MSKSYKRRKYPVSGAPNVALPVPDEDVVAAREFLQRHAKLNLLIEEKLRYRKRLIDLANRTSADPFARDGAAMEESRRAAVVRMRDLEAEIDRDIDHLVNLRNEIWLVLDQLENPEIALLLDDRYVQGLSSEQAAKRIGYCRRYADRLCRWGLGEVARLLREQRPMRSYVPPTIPPQESA